MQAGTPAFQPPEQLKGEAIGVGTDIYALACHSGSVWRKASVGGPISPYHYLNVAGGSFLLLSDHLQPPC